MANIQGVTQTRANALKGQYVRLYCRFIKNGQMMDPMTQPKVRIVDNSYYQESSSSSSESASSLNSSSMTSGSLPDSVSSSSTYQDHGQGYGPFWAQKESTGVWFIDWFVPTTVTQSQLYDIWSFQWDNASPREEMIFEIAINEGDNTIDWVSPQLALRIETNTSQLMNDLSNLFIYEAQHIPVYWEQGYRTGDARTFNFAYGNWQRDPRVIVRKNEETLITGFYADYNGTIRWDQDLEPEDSIYAQYQFRYFSDEEVLDFLDMGLYAMNGVPPASTAYSSVEAAPFEWRYGILLQAAIFALRRLVFGFNFIERTFVLGENIDDQQRKIEQFKQLYTSYQEIWAEWAKNVKTRKLPEMRQIVTPEYTLPGGRSRWFRYMYKS